MLNIFADIAIRIHVQHAVSRSLAAADPHDRTHRQSQKLRCMLLQLLFLRKGNALYIRKPLHGLRGNPRLLQSSAVKAALLAGPFQRLLQPLQLQFRQLLPLHLFHLWIRVHAIPPNRN